MSAGPTDLTGLLFFVAGTAGGIVLTTAALIFTVMSRDRPGARLAYLGVTLNYIACFTAPVVGAIALRDTLAQFGAETAMKAWLSAMSPGLCVALLTSSLALIAMASSRSRGDSTVSALEES